MQTCLQYLNFGVRKIATHTEIRDLRETQGMCYDCYYYMNYACDTFRQVTHIGKKSWAYLAGKENESRQPVPIVPCFTQGTVSSHPSQSNLKE